MELVWIEDFLALLHVRNFTRAADMRHTTQSAYSRRIARLEAWLGAKLFMRETRPVALTRAGEELAKRLPRLREDILDIRRITANISTDLPEAIRLYTTNTIAIGVLPHWMATKNLEAYSLVVSNVTTCLEAIRQGRADIALIPVLGDVNAENIVEVAVDHLVFCAAKDLASRVVLQEGCLRGPLMIYTPGTAYGQFIAQKLKEHHITLQNTALCESASAEALLAQIRVGRGAAWIPESLLSDTEKTEFILESMPRFSYSIGMLERGGAV